MRTVGWAKARDIKRRSPQSKIKEIGGGRYLVFEIPNAVSTIEKKKISLSWPDFTIPQVKLEDMLNFACNLGEWTLIAIAIQYMLNGLK